MNSDIKERAQLNSPFNEHSETRGNVVKETQDFEIKGRNGYSDDDSSINDNKYFNKNLDDDSNKDVVGVI